MFPPIADLCILIIEAISLILYLIVTIFMIQSLNTSQAFHTSFIILFVFNGIYGFLSFIILILFWYFPKWGLFMHYYASNEWLSIIYILTFYQFQTLLIIGNVILTVNKFFAVYEPIFYKMCWTKNASYIIVIFQVVVTYLYYSYLYFIGAIFVGDVDRAYFTKSEWKYILFDKIAFCFICWFSTIIMFILTARIGLKFNKYIFKNNESTLLTKFQSFLLMSVSNLILFSLSVISSVTIYATAIDNDDTRLRMNNHTSRILPLLACSAPYCLILSTKGFRDNFWHFLKCSALKNKQSKTIVTAYFSKKNVAFN
uniref:Serpentine receptor class gamma n=1 Tax=Strongyloides papillosus TaxID=174720 RepID=A0A0N5C4Y2_STREA